MGLRRLLVAVGVVAASSLVLAGPAGAAPPANDEITSATQVSRLPFSDSLSTVEATPAAGDPECVGVGPTVWYALTLRRNTTVTVSTAGSNYDTTLSAYTGSPGNLTQIACNDDFGGLQSQIEFSVARRQTVYVMVGSFAGGPGGSLSISMVEAGRADRPVPPVGLNRLLSGPFTGTASFEFDARGCAFVFQQFDGTYETKRGVGTLHVEGCVDVSTLGFAGTFVIRAPTGTTITGTAEGTVFPLDLTLTVTRSVGGTGQLRRLTGTIDFTADGISGEISGALRAAVRKTGR